MKAEPSRLSQKEPFRWRSVFPIVFLVLCAFFLTALWKWTPVSEVVNQETVESWFRELKSSRFQTFWVLGVYLLGALLLLPVNFLLIGTTVVFPGWHGFFYSYLGCLCSAAVGFFCGRWLGQHLLQRLLGKRADLINRHLLRRGVMTIAILRMLPVGPFPAINLVAGTTGLRFRDFVLGTILGLLPGILLLALFGTQLFSVFRDPSPMNILLLGAVIILGAGTVLLLRKKLRRSAIESKCMVQ